MKSGVILVLASAIAASVFAQQQPVRCSGTVRYPSGEPAAGVHVTFYPGVYYGEDDYNFHEAVSDERGRYEIMQPQKVAMFHFGPEFLTNCVLARDLENNLAAVQAFQRETTNVDLTLQPAIALSGSVQDTEGMPVATAEIELGFESARTFLTMHPPFEADAMGQFHISALPQGIEYGVSISAKGYGSSHGRVEAKNTQAIRYEFPTFVLKRADHKLAGRVVGNAGEPLVGAWVQSSGDGQPLNFNTNTDSEGRFSFNGVCEGPLKIFASYSDSVDPSIYMSLNRGSGMEVKPGDTNILIELRDTSISAWDVPTLVTKGTVSDPDGKPVPNVVFAVWHSANPFKTFSSGFDGTYKVRWQRPLGVKSRLKSVLLGRDSSRNLVVVREIDETSTNLDVELQSGLAVGGVLLDEKGMAVTNARVSLIMALGSTAELTKTLTDDKGCFSFAGLPLKGKYSLDVGTANSGCRGVPGKLQVPGGNTNLVLKLAFPLKDYDSDRLPIYSNR